MQVSYQAGFAGLKKKILGEVFHIILAHILTLRVKGHDMKQLTCSLKGETEDNWGLNEHWSPPPLPAVLWVIGVGSFTTSAPPYKHCLNMQYIMLVVYIYM